MIINFPSARRIDLIIIENNGHCGLINEHDLSMCTSFREHSLAQVLVKLREQLSKANALTREANFLADEMAKSTEYSVTLQIPAASLNPNGKVRNDREKKENYLKNPLGLIQKGGIISEPAILVKRDNKSSQIWSLEKLENKVVEMRDLYEEWKDTSYPTRTPLENPFNQNVTSSSGEEVCLSISAIEFIHGNDLLNCDDICSEFAMSLMPIVAGTLPISLGNNVRLMMYETAS